MPEKELEQVFFGLIEDLKNYSDYLVLVGGWLPWLYTEFLWKVKKYSPVMTQDIDIGVKEFYRFHGENITDCLLKRKYLSRSIYPEEQTPIQFIFKDKEKEYPIDFIIGEWSSPAIIQRMTGKDLYVSSIDYFEIFNKNIQSYFKSENSKGPNFVAEYFSDKDPYFKKYVKNIFTKLLERLSK